MRIGVDIDDVLGGCVIELNRFYNHCHGTDFKFEDYVFYDLEKVWGCNREESVKAIFNFYQHTFFKDIKPVEFSREVLNFLSRENEFIAITYRPDLVREETERWIEEYFPEIQKIIYSGLYNPLEKKTKLDICKVEDIDLIIDDHFETIIQCSRGGLASILFDRPWNQTNFVDGFSRVKNWKEILEDLK